MNQTTYVNGLAFVNKMIVDHRKGFEEMNYVVFDSNLVDLVANQMSVKDVETVLCDAYDKAEDRLNEMLKNNQLTPEVREEVIFEFEFIDYFKTIIEAVA